MNPQQPTPDQHQFIERFSRWWEMAGSRSSGRIVGWLMICEPPYRSAAELAEQLQLSTGSVSTQTTNLERVGFLERVTFPGDRLTYYQMPPGVWLVLVQNETVRAQEMKDLAAAASEVMPSERTDRIEGLDGLATYLLERWPGILDEIAEYLQKDETT